MVELFRRASAIAVSAMAVAAIALASIAGAQQLGSIGFPNSGKPEAQAPFIRGVLLLHSFEYATAATAFRDAQRADPDFALAFWGEAMTYTHQVWNEQDLSAARGALARLGTTPAARREKARTHREQMYLDAIEALYGGGSKEKRDTLFADAMERLTKTHPDDDEALAFYSLALLGLSQGVRNIPTYVRAGALAQDLLRRQPDHPGAAHYTIHAFDDPIHAPLGLHAARLYSKIAPAAPHAQHMTTHIFVAMGMWDDVVSQNVIASGHDHEHWRAGHYTAWLGYGYLQQGRFAEARKHLELMRANAGQPSRRGEQPSLLSMRAQYVINSERWTDPVVDWRIAAPDAAFVAQAMDAFASGYAAIKTGQRPKAEQALAEILRSSKAIPKDDFYSANVRVPQILERQLRALLLVQDGKRADALAILREAATLEDAIPLEYGPPDVVKPTHELLGEVLLAAGQLGDAQREFVRALELAPGRARSLLGLARAAAAAGDRTVAQRALGELKRNWRQADRSLNELEEIERLLAGKNGG